MWNLSGRDQSSKKMKIKFAKIGGCEPKPKIRWGVFCVCPVMFGNHHPTHIHENSVYTATRMAVMDYWGMRVVNPFRRLSYKNISRDFADYLPKDLFVFCPARLQQIPEEEWMKRET